MDRGCVARGRSQLRSAQSQISTLLRSIIRGIMRSMDFLDGCALLEDFWAEPLKSGNEMSQIEPVRPAASEPDPDRGAPNRQSPSG